MGKSFAISFAAKNGRAMLGDKSCEISPDMK